MRRFILPLFSILVTATRPISPVRFDVRAAARLQVDAAVLADDDEAHAAGAHRRLDRQGAHQARIGLQLGVADPAVADGVIGGDQRVELARQRVLVDRGWVLDVEIEPAVVGVDLAAGDGELHQRAQQMQAGVHAHQPVARVPVEHDADALAGCGERAALGRDVHDAGLVGVVDGGGDRAAAAALQLDQPLVAGLPAGGRVEHGAVEDDAAALVDAEHARAAVALVGIGPVELLGHGCHPGALPSPSGRGREAMTYGSLRPAAAQCVRGRKSSGRTGEGRLRRGDDAPHPVLRTTFSPRGEGTQRLVRNSIDIKPCRHRRTSSAARRAACRATRAPAGSSSAGTPG